MINKRVEIGNTVIEQLHELLEKTTQYPENKSDGNRNKIAGKLRNLLIECGPEVEYSATAATTLLTDPHYKEIKLLLKTHNLWDNEFDLLEQQVEFCALI